MKNCITILSRGDIQTLKELKGSLDSLYEKYVNDFPCDVVIFHEEGFSEQFKKLANERYSNIKFKEIKLTAPENLTKENLNFKDPTPFLGLSYRNMCRFFAMEFYKQLAEYDWYWRLDVDSVLLNKIEFDVFKYLEENNKVYGYVAELPEHPPVIQGFGDFIKHYQKEFNTPGKFTDYFFDSKGNYNFRMIYNNFEICKLNIFNDTKVKQFLSEIDKTGKIYEYRWGDAPIRTLMLSLFVDRNQIHRFQNIGYLHQEFTQQDGVLDCKYIPFDWIKNEDFIS